MTFQNYVYTLICETSGLSCGCYPNFKKAYEVLEEREEGKIIVDCGYDYIRSVCFDVINPKSFYKTKTYTIYRDLLTIYDERELITYEMVKSIEKENKRHNKNSNYRLKGEVI